MRVTGTYSISVRRNGLLIAERAGKNTIMTAGLHGIAALIAGTVPPIKYAAFGASDDDINVSHTGLQGVEHWRLQLAASSTGSVFTLQGDIIANAAPIGGTSQPIREVGIFNAASGPPMFARFLPTQYNFGSAGEIMEFRWDLEVE